MMLRDHSPSGNQKLAWAATRGALIEELDARLDAPWPFAGESG
jgi:hypothetical protein